MTLLPLAIDPRHPAFEGHFPSRPIVPGVVLLDHGLRAIADHRRTLRGSTTDRVCRIGMAKFLSVIGPGEPVRLEFDEADDSRYQVRIFAGEPDRERLALTGSVVFEIAASTADEGSAR